MSDPIEKQAAIDALKVRATMNGRADGKSLTKLVAFKIVNDYADYVRKRIEALPPAQPEQRWIPCSKTIDIPDHEVLCCDRHGEELIGWLSYIDDQWLCESDGEMMYNPVAWREKPEPYREEGEADD